MLRVFAKKLVPRAAVQTRWGSVLDSVKSQAGGEPDGLFLTPGCVERIHRQNEVDSEKPFLRLKVVSGGCQGAMYDFDWDDARQDGDKLFESGGAKLLVDTDTYDTVRGSVIDFKYELKGNAFQVQRPGDDSYQTCSCGASFAMS